MEFGDFVFFCLHCPLEWKSSQSHFFPTFFGVGVGFGDDDDVGSEAHKTPHTPPHPGQKD